MGSNHLKEGDINPLKGTRFHNFCHSIFQREELFLPFPLKRIPPPQVPRSKKKSLWVEYLLFFEIYTLSLHDALPIYHLKEGDINPLKGLRLHTFCHSIFQRCERIPFPWMQDPGKRAFEQKICWSSRSTTSFHQLESI